MKPLFREGQIVRKKKGELYKITKIQRKDKIFTDFYIVLNLYKDYIFCMSMKKAHNTFVPCEIGQVLYGEEE